MADEAILGWDIGGAHLKAARVVAGGRVERVLQFPCPLWQGLDHLAQALERALERLGPAERHAVTMTGELVDLFTGRAEGVVALMDEFARHAPHADISIYAGPAGFLPPEAASGHARVIASVNWLASASWAAARLGDGLLVDLGSTTADVIPFAGGRVRVRAYCDADRLVERELVYTGLTRTPVMVVTDSVPFRGRRYPLMAEHFATMADVHRLTGALPEVADQYPAADGRGKTPQDSARRLARMIGHDLEEAGMADWRGLARHLAECQRHRLEEACRLVLSRGEVAGDAPVVGAGVGRPVVAALAARLGRPYEDFATLVEGDAAIREAAADSAPATAVALLLRDA